MDLNDAIDSIYSNFEEAGYDWQKLEQVMKEIQEGHEFVKSLYKDLNFLNYLKKDKKLVDKCYQEVLTARGIQQGITTNKKS